MSSAITISLGPWFLLSRPIENAEVEAFMVVSRDRVRAGRVRVGDTDKAAEAVLLCCREGLGESVVPRRAWRDNSGELGRDAKTDLPDLDLGLDVAGASLPLEPDSSVS